MSYGDGTSETERLFNELLASANKGEHVPIDDKDYRFGLKFENRSNNPDPAYATAGSSGFDLRANLGSEIISLRANGGYQLIHTGLYFEIPPNFEIQVRSRSGLALKNGVAVLNAPGTVDSDYRGECSVILINHGNVPFVVRHGDRIAQAVVMSVINTNIIRLTKVDKISENVTRGENGFGSTGVH